MLDLPTMARGMARKAPSPTTYLKWSTVWGITVAVVMVAFLLFIGPGLEQSRQGLLGVSQ